MRLEATCGTEMSRNPVKFRISDFGFRIIRWLRLKSAIRIPHSAIWCQSALRTPHSAWDEGQALVELAIFGSLLILVLGALVNYGLNADFTQQAMMRTFRQSLVTAAQSEQQNPPTPVSASHVFLEDRHIPNPSHPFGIGPVIPVSGQGSSPSRTHKLPLTPEKLEELPRQYVTLQGVALNCPATGSGCLTAGFRDEQDVPGFIEQKDGKWTNNPDRVDLIDKYEEIYGRSSSFDLGPGSCEGCRNIRIVDGCEGEIISRDNCARQAAQIMDQDVCARECEKGKQPGSTLDCNAVCAQSIHVPWYAEGGSKDSGFWVFPALDRVFAGVRALGLQPDYVRRTVMTNGLIKQETRADITTISSNDWSAQTQRALFYRDPATGERVVKEDDQTKTTIGESDETTWTTPW